MATDIRVADFELDAIVWVSSEEVVWRPGRVIKSDSKEFISVEFEGSEQDDPEVIRVPISAPTGGKTKSVRLLRRNTALLGEKALNFDDLTEVPELHEAAVLHALDVRFAHSRIYTLTGAVLLAVNPFRTIPNLYSPDELQSFLTGAGQNKSTKQRPHIFGTASRALRGIREKSLSQTILISGESGAGKTESTKFVMQFLALAGSVDPKQPNSVGQHGMSRVEKQVLGSNPLLEAFGNAKTLRNDNSSRFGKFIELQFAPQAPPSGGFYADEAELQAAPRLEGARIRTYLLEKVRVIAQKDGERSFHVFYQALAAAKTPERLAAAGKPLMEATQEQVEQSHAIGMGTRGDFLHEVDLDGFVGFSLDKFQYLHQAGSKPGTLAGVIEADEFEATLSAMRTVGLGPAETSDIFHVLAAVLHIGNIQFVSPDGESSNVAASETNSLEIASRLLGVTAQDLERSLCKRTVQRNNEAKKVLESIVSNVNAEKAYETRDALARYAYQAVFSHIVERTNASIGYRERALYCGVLDIFGFEFFEKNSFEQLCINYTNEMLQQFFNSYIFENEIALYKEEGISWKDLTFPDNVKIVDLLRMRGGIFPALDEECFILSGSSKNWCSQMLKAHENHSNFSFVKQKPGEFIIQHFAGPVTYTADGFLEKNKDQLSRDVLLCLQGSKSLFVSKRFHEQDRAFGVNSTEGGSQKVMKAKRYTVSAEFREQLDDLMKRMRETSPHFVRCIKSNPQNKPYVDDDPASTNPYEEEDGDVKRKPRFDRKAVVEQLSYQGVLEAIRVARSGYPVRFLHHDFLSDFRCLAGSELQDRLKKAVSESGAELDSTVTANLVRQLVDCREIQGLLETSKRDNVAGPIGWAVGKTRIFLKLDQFNFLKSAQVKVRHASATKIQAAWLCKVGFRNFKKFRKGMLCMQAKIRGALVRNRLWREKRERAAISMEAGFRTLLARSQANRMHAAAKVLQNFARRNHCRTEFLKTRSRVVKLQRWWRSCVKRRRWRHFQKNVLLIQRVCKGALGRRRATDQLARKRCLARVVRKLIRIRRKQIAYRAWKEKTMAWYKQKRTYQPSFDHKTLAAGTLKLWQKDQAQELEIARLRESNRRLEEQCESLGYYAWLRVRRCFNAEPMPIPTGTHSL